MIGGAESASEVNRFAARQKQRPFAVLYRTGNNRARADSRADAPSARGVFVISAALPEILIDVEDNADCLFGMPRVRNGKSKDRDDALSVGGVQISTLFNEMRSGLANKFCSRFRKSGGLRIFRQRKFVAGSARPPTYCVWFWLGSEPSLSLGNAAKLLFLAGIRTKCSYQIRAGH